MNFEEESGGKSGGKVSSENQDIDLYEAHNFDIKLDIDIPKTSRSVSAGLIWRIKKFEVFYLIFFKIIISWVE